MPELLDDRSSSPPLVLESFPAEPRSAASARRVLLDRLGRRFAPEVVDTVLLLSTELISNAAAWASGPITLRIYCDPEGLLHVEVADSVKMTPRAVTDLGPEAEHGRGLSLVQALSHDWGARTVPNGKVVWFTLQPDGAAAAGQAHGHARAG